MLKSIDIINDKKNKFTINFVNIEESFITAVEKYQLLWQDKTIKPLYNFLFEKVQNIFIASSSTEINDKEKNKELEGCDLTNADIKQLFDWMNVDKHLYIAMHGENFIGISSYYLENKMSDEDFFQTISHELVHSIDYFLFYETGIYNKLKGDNLSNFNKSAENILSLVKKVQDSGDKSFGEVNTVDALENDYEILPYCIQAYVAALMFDNESAVQIKNDIKNLVEITVNLAGGAK